MNPNEGRFGAVGDPRDYRSSSRTQQSVQYCSRRHGMPPQGQNQAQNHIQNQNYARNSYYQQHPSVTTVRTQHHTRAAGSEDQTMTQQSEKRRSLRIKHFQEAFRRKDMELYVNFRIGNGKYSKVYKAYDMRTNKMIAIKAIDLTQLSADVRNKFLPREISCWKRLKHQFIVEMHAQYEAGNMIFLAMEFAQHGDLLHFVQKHGALDEHRAGRYMSQLFMALDYMHSKQIAHRDIKLENIVIFDEGIKLSDFGFVRQMEAETLSSTFCGSKSYSAPELLRGIKYDPFLSDVWSAGVVGFVMVTDRMPFNESLPNHTIVEHQRTHHYHFSNKLNLSPSCTSTIENLMTFEANSRPSSAQCLNLPWISSHSTNMRF